MATLGQAGVRKEPFDRTYVDVGVMSSVFSAIGPHGSTQRWTFTVPSNKRATLSFAQAYFYRVTAAAPVGEVVDSIQYTPNAGVARIFFAAAGIKNAIGDEAHAEFGSQFTLQAGDVINGFTADAGTGGTVTHRILSLIEQYDA